MNELKNKVHEKNGDFAKMLEAKAQWMHIKHSEPGKNNVGRIYQDETGELKCTKDGIAFKYARSTGKFAAGDDKLKMDPLFPTEADFLRPGADKKAKEWAWEYARREARGRVLNGKPWGESRIKKSYTDLMHGYDDFVKLLEKERADSSAAAVASQG